MSIILASNGHSRSVILSGYLTFSLRFLFILSLLLPLSPLFLPYSSFLLPSLLSPPLHPPGASLLYYYSLPQSFGLSIAFKYTSCAGSEYNILDCSHSCPNYYYSCNFRCSHYMDIGIKCQRKSYFPGFAILHLINNF